jgi:hypothetical protein
MHVEFICLKEPPSFYHSFVYHRPSLDAKLASWNNSRKQIPELPQDKLWRASLRMRGAMRLRASVYTPYAECPCRSLRYTLRELKDVVTKQD